MKKVALIVESSRSLAKDIRDRVESLDHEVLVVSTQKEALKALGGSKWVDYILVDLEVPVAKGRPARVQNGLNLVRKIRALPNAGQLPVIALTSHGSTHPNLAVESMRVGGADDFINTPLPDKGFTLELRITDLLEKRGLSTEGRSTSGGGATTKSGLPSRPTVNPARPHLPRPFPGGELKFYQYHVALSGVRLCAQGLGRGILEELAKRSSAGGYRALSGSELARRLHCEGGQNTIACAVRDLRKKVSERLLAEGGWVVGPRDFIESGGAGYRFSEKVRLGVVVG